MMQSSPTAVGDEKYLLVKGIAGLGDRMQCVLTAIVYARLTRRRLLVDWTDHYYSKGDINAFHAFFECALCDPTDVIPRTESVAPVIWRGRLGESAWHMRKLYGDINNPETWRQFSINPEILDHREDVTVLWTYQHQLESLRKHFTGPLNQFAAAPAAVILRKLLREDLRLKPHIRKRVDDFKSRCFVRPTVGVHVRYTDHRSRLFAILRTLNKLLKEVPNAQVFLSTDNHKIKELFEESYPAVTSTSHWYASRPGLALHTQRSRVDPVENGVEALVDLYLLSECDYLIFDSSSSFGYVASLLTGASPSAIFRIGREGKRSARSRRVIYRAMLKTGLFSWGVQGLQEILKLRNRRLLAARRFRSCSNAS